MTLGLGVIGLGVQGRRMIARLAEHGGMCAVAGWDPRPWDGGIPGAEGMHIASSPAEVIAAPGVDCLYIASPPASHMALANQAFDRGLPVFCEKPLAVDFEEARLTIDRIERDGLRGAVNFSLASSAGLGVLQEALQRKALGELRGVRIEARFRQWPRPWQAAAGSWLGERGEGGFTREVLSHFIFVLQRVLGPATVERTVVAYPGDAASSETSVDARLEARGVPVSVKGSVGGSDADFNRLAVVGERDTLEFREWMATPAAGARPGYLRQLDQLAAFIAGEPHLLPGFAEALAVQETIEAMLNGGNG